MKCDLHCHTSFSYDTTASPKEMIDAALKKGINCLAITDHNEIKGALEAVEYAKGKPILIIPGIEVKTKEGDILGLNVKAIIPKGLSVKETIKKIKEAGGMAILPHPFGWLCSFKGNLEDIVTEFEEAIASSHASAKASAIDGVEVLNASLFGEENKKALDFAKKYNLPFTVGSDAHFPNFVGRCYLEIPGENLSVEEILKAIKNKNVRIGGSKSGCFEKIIDHIKRNIAKLKNL